MTVKNVIYHLRVVIITIPLMYKVTSMKDYVLLRAGCLDNSVWCISQFHRHGDRAGFHRSCLHRVTEFSHHNSSFSR